MTKINFKNREQKTIAAILAIGSITVFGLFGMVSTTTAQQEDRHYTGSVQGTSVTGHPTSLQDPFAITVNGHKEPTVIATVKRGQTAQIDVFIAPKIAGITGDVSVQSVKPICGSTPVSRIGCTPAGITTTLSENTVSVAKHFILTINVSDSMPSGTYSYEVISMAQSHISYQAGPVAGGDIDSFAITVV